MELQSFDIEVGMAVLGASGQTIGSVTEIAGFGSTRVDHASDLHATKVTQAQTGTGYIKVARSGSEDLYVPFRGIRDVVPDHGVTLNDTIIEELRHQLDPTTTMIAATPQRRWWPKWR
jgi:hypothetical protein